MIPGTVFDDFHNLFSAETLPPQNNVYGVMIFISGKVTEKYYTDDD